MIQSIGIDTVAIDRFYDWQERSDTALARLFAPEEIAYCKTNTTTAAERFAVRFAAREAFFKAYNIITSDPLPFLSVCKAITIANGARQEPRILFTKTPQGRVLEGQLASFTLHITLSHTKTDAIALVIISK